MFGREQLGDPLGERGKAVSIAPIKIPSFDNAIKMQGDNNALMLQAAKYHQEQQQKEAALQLQRDKMAQEAAQKAEVERARRQAEIFKLLTPETDPLMGDAPKWAAEAYGGLLKEAQGLYDRGIDINSFHPEAVAFRSGPLLNYHTNYKRHAEIAKSFIEKQKVWQGKPLEFEAYSLANDDILPYNKSGWNGEYYPKSLNPIIEPAKEEDFNKLFVAPIKFSEREDVDLKKPKAFGSNVIYPTSTQFTPVGNAFEDAKSKAEYYGNTPNLPTEDIPMSKRVKSKAKEYGALNEDGTINAELFAKKVVENAAPAPKYGTKTADIDKPRSESDNTSKFIRQFYGNSLIMGTKTTPVAVTPAKSDINAGKIENGTEYFLQPAAEITGTKMNNLPGNTLGANSAWKIDSEGKVTPVESNEDVGGIPTDRIVYLATNEQGQPYMSYQNSKVGANKNVSARFSSKGRNYQTFAYKTDKDGNVIVVNLHKSFNGTLSERGIATELTPQEIDAINDRNQQQAQQPQTPVQENAPAGMKPKDKKAEKQF